MRRGPAAGFLVVLVVSVDACRTADASPSGVETDHIDAADDGGPRRLGLLADGVATALGRIAIEVDGVVFGNVALSVQIDHGMWNDVRVFGAQAGFVAFPLRFAFRGFYVHPRVGLSSESDPSSPMVLSPAVTVGYEWVCPAGCTLRLGGGGAYGVALSSDSDEGAVHAPRPGIRPVLDVGVGWIF